MATAEPTDMETLTRQLQEAGRLCGSKDKEIKILEFELRATKRHLETVKKDRNEEYKVLMKQHQESRASAEKAEYEVKGLQHELKRAQTEVCPCPKN
jgi:chromosome segregation ATPase